MKHQLMGGDGQRAASRASDAMMSQGENIESTWGASVGLTLAPREGGM